jgi:hypothetical protein
MRAGCIFVLSLACTTAEEVPPDSSFSSESERPAKTCEPGQSRFVLAMALVEAI